MKTLFYVILTVALLFLAATFFVKNSSKQQSKSVIVEDVIEVNPELTGNEDETIIEDADIILPHEETSEPEPETIISE